MPETVNEEKTTTKNDRWRERIAKQERSGLSVRQFCEDQGLTEYSFYAWRKRLPGAGPVRFALVEREERCGKSLRPRQVWNWCWLPALPSAERTAYPRFARVHAGQAETGFAASNMRSRQHTFCLLVLLNSFSAIALFPHS